MILVVFGGPFFELWILFGPLGKDKAGQVKLVCEIGPLSFNDHTNLILGRGQEGVKAPTF